MKRSEIFALAKQAGGHFDGSDWRFCCDFDADDLARFASLVAESEREACARIADDAADGIGRIEDDIGASIAKAIRARGAA